MAAKRLLGEKTSHDPDQPEGKRIKNRPSFATVISEVVMVNSLQNFCAALEPMLRRVVNEEVESGLRRGLSSVYRSPSLQIQALEASTLQLSFSNKLSLPIFTGSKIEDIEKNPLQITLIDTRNDKKIPTRLSYPIKVEIVVLDGDFPAGDGDDWTSEEFDRKIVRERTGRRPLLTGDVIISVRDGHAVIGDLVFTDNSSWIRSRNFRLGARMMPGSCQGVRVREAKTEPFVVKDHRGELYKKHYPPSLDDEVWRLEKIGKDGAFHKKLTEQGLNTVQDFLKLWVVDSVRLRAILGVGMSEKIWEATIRHARTCYMGTKVYMFRGLHYTIVLNPICQVVGAMINGEAFPTQDLTRVDPAHIKRLVRNAYEKWDSLEEVDELLNENAIISSSGNMEVCYHHDHHNHHHHHHHHHRHHHHQNDVRLSQEHGDPTHMFMEVASIPSDWQHDHRYISAGDENEIFYNMSDSS